MKLQKLTTYCNEFLAIDDIKDYCPNGLQVESNPFVKKIITGVTASQALIDAAIAEKADTLIVHHGFFWNNEAAPLVGIKGKRIRYLFQSKINLLAYHLPLDMHLTLGNNQQLGMILGFNHPAPVDLKNPLLWQSTLSTAISAKQLKHQITHQLGRKPLLIKAGKKPIKKVAWCTGGAQSMIEDAVKIGADAFISGEISESTTHIAREAGIHYFSAGHHATENYGVMALGQHLAKKFKGIEVAHINIFNPV